MLAEKLELERELKLLKHKLQRASDKLDGAAADYRQVCPLHYIISCTRYVNYLTNLTKGIETIC